MLFRGSADLLKQMQDRFANEGVLRHVFYMMLLSVVVFLFVFSWMNWLQQELTPPVRAQIEAGIKGKKQQSSASARSDKDSVNLREYKQQIARDLFGSQRGQEEESESKVSLEDIPLSEKDLGLELVGTIIRDNPKHDIAIIEDKQKNEQYMYYEGDHIKDVSIKEILRDNVVIVQAKEQKILTMQYKELRKPEAQENNRKVSSESIQSPGREKSISKDYVMESIGNMSTLMQDALIKPYMKNGETIGFQLDNIRSGSFYDKLGLKNSDVILQVENKKLKSPQQLMELSQELSRKNQVELTIQRNGKQRTISYRLQ